MHEGERRHRGCTKEKGNTEVARRKVETQSIMEIHLDLHCFLLCEAKSKDSVTAAGWAKPTRIYTHILEAQGRASRDLRLFLKLINLDPMLKYSQIDTQDGLIFPANFR